MQKATARHKIANDDDEPKLFSFLIAKNCQLDIFRPLTSNLRHSDLISDPTDEGIEARGSWQGVRSVKQWERVTVEYFYEDRIKKSSFSDLLPQSSGLTPLAPRPKTNSKPSAL
jgi:hypothetical protein